MEEFLTAQQTANLLQLHVKTIHKLARRGAIPGIKLGGWRFSKALVYRMINPNGHSGDNPILNVLDGI